MLVLDRAILDFVRTFGRPGIFEGIEPKMVPVDKDNPKGEKMQAREKDGNGLKWTAIVAVRITNFDKIKPMHLLITLTSPTNPCANIPEGQAVIVESLEMGLMKQEKGFSQFFSATAIRPVQPARPASGQS